MVKMCVFRVRLFELPTSPRWHPLLLLLLVCDAHHIRTLPFARFANNHHCRSRRSATQFSLPIAEGCGGSSRASAFCDSFPRSFPYNPYGLLPTTHLEPHYFAPGTHTHTHTHTGTHTDTIWHRKHTSKSIESGTRSHSLPASFGKGRKQGYAGVDPF
uniref:Putative secreted protein n=1 Tax=Anopheles triannulatus TaxID=58253 RepID=A0A2M4B1H5_9DIPT